MFENSIININGFFIGITFVLLVIILRNNLPKSILYYLNNYIVIKILFLSFILPYIYTKNINIALVSTVFVFILYLITIKINKEEKEDFSENYNEINTDIDNELIEKIKKNDENNNYEHHEDIEDFTPENLKYLNY